MKGFQKTICFCIFINFSILFLLYAQAPSKSQKQLVINKCSKCHDVSPYIYPRSRRSWELTVYDMQNMGADEEESYTDEEAEKIIDYLAYYFGADSERDPFEHFEEGTDAHPETVIKVPLITDKNGEEVKTDESEVKLPSIRKNLPKEVQERLKNYKPFSPELLVLARLSGFAAVFFLLSLILSGHSRKKLRKKFKPIHITAASGLFFALSLHGIIYIIRYGNPPVDWYWLGIISFSVLVFAEFQGVVRKKFGPKFLKIHVSLGYTGILMAILHWILAWI